MAKRENFRRIGLLLPSSNSTQEPEIYKSLPAGMSLHTTRLQLSDIEPESTLRIVEQLEDASRKLADADVDMIMLAATAPSSRMGLGYDQELIRRITAASGKPATTASTALLEALRALGAKKIVIGAPWTDAVNETAASFIEANGFRVLAHQAIGLVRNLEVGLLDSQTAYDMARRIDRPDADAVMLACGNWRTFDIIDRLERDLGKPVLTTNQVSVWHVFKALGAGSLPGYGVLLREHLAQDLQPRLARAV